MGVLVLLLWRNIVPLLHLPLFRCSVSVSVESVRNLFLPTLLQLLPALLLPALLLPVLALVISASGPRVRANGALSYQAP